jgi:acetyl-CoA acetyltransferase
VKDVVNSLGGIQVLFPILESAASFTQSAASTPPTTAAEDAAFLPSSQVCTTIHQCCGSGSGSFYHQAKKVRKTLIPTALWLLFDFLSLKMMYMYGTFKKQKNFLKI